MKRDLEIRLIQNEDEYNKILTLRRIVFVREQNVPPKIEFDGLDKESTHIIVKLGKEMIGCARIRSFNGKIKLERIAILKEYRSQGFGKRLIQYLLYYSKQGNAKEIIVHAQYHMKSFYEEFGFKTRGKTFREAGIKHIEMYEAKM